MVFIDDGWLVMSQDLVQDFMADRDKHLCTPFAWFTLQKWIYKQLKVRQIHWYSDQRIFHHPPVSNVFEKFQNRSNICREFISLHGAYPKEMMILQSNLEKGKLENNGSTFNLTYSLPEITDNCEFKRYQFNYTWFKPPYYFEPVPCARRPIWNQSALWAGREGFNGVIDD